MFGQYIDPENAGAWRGDLMAANTATVLGCKLIWVVTSPIPAWTGFDVAGCTLCMSRFS